MPIRLQFHGASRSVTGSCFALDNGRCRILIDCGMFQGSKTEKELNYRDFPFVPRDIHAMLLTHAHIDHSGLIPKLVKHGFQGPILATGATVDLCSVMLPDSGHIQEVEVDQLNRRNARRGLPHVTPIYTAEDATAAMTQCRPVTLGAWAQAGPGIRARYWNAGHLLGSASIEVEVQHDERPPVRVLFSGDIGPDDKLLEHAPEGPSGVDYVLCESTYGDTDRLETNFTRRRALLRAELEAAKRRDGALLIPSFAVERTQELLVDIVALMQAGSVPQAPIFIDSPLASRASAIFARHAREIPAGDDLTRALAMPNVRVTESVEQSKAIGRLSGFHIISAASVMCEAGRIRHHLR
ncbi:MAG: MBL fold metallo-hydrolase, partial [Rhizobiales bacterium]|nr:MBL fold metallo-hydrolase [Hyphomicrobiales bacterium]